ncbi:LAMI_0H19372g1_1 [Lachancea mirantina]|uniref:LAMI_0H19372g1_1 n=1 Tax=Lachancea mirantina TaxID=1230905 RepID=A0A1G4KK06_9SACH|nr:LAMI_0H19372g1_1 [Lachancea mirantina]
MNPIEAKRIALEELEVIEKAIADRIGRNPALFYDYFDELKAIEGEKAIDVPVTKAQATQNRIWKISKPRRSKKQVALQQHEIKSFLDRYNETSHFIDGTTGEDVSDFEDPHGTFAALEGSIETLKSRFQGTENSDSEQSTILSRQYSMFSASTEEYKNILSMKSHFLDINEIFSREEQYGETLSLENYYQQWMGIASDSSTSFLQFIKIVENFKDEAFLISPSVDRNAKKYIEFLKSFSIYITSFFYRVYPWMNKEVLEDEITSSFPKYLGSPIASSNGLTFCIPCGKTFKTESVYGNHLLGRKHQKSLNGRKDKLLLEYRVHKYVGYLKNHVEDTRNFIERQLAFTAEERAQEMERISDLYQAPAFGDEEKEHLPSQQDEESSMTPPPTENSLDMPLGPDGFPIPHWLYKLQGLNIEYACEICGNHVYRGRRRYEKHFTEARHVYGLKMLGIEAAPSFQGISSIEEATELWKTIRNKKTSSKAKLEVEIEDEDGNVMTERVYHDLKKQGLI